MFYPGYMLAEKFIKYYFILNAGAASIIAVYFLEHSQDQIYLQYAVLCFMVGTIFSILAILLDFFWSYFSLRNFQRIFFKLRDEGAENFKKRTTSYMHYQEKNKEKNNKTILLRIFNGLLSYIAFSTGLFVIIFSKSNHSFNILYSWILVICALYSSAMIVKIYKCIRVG